MFLPRDADRVIGTAVAGPLAATRVPLRAAAGRVLAEDIAAGVAASQLLPTAERSSFYYSMLIYGNCTERDLSTLLLTGH